MTPTQRQQHINAIQSILTTCGFTKDAYGNYKYQKDNREYRAKFKSINLRLERKGTNQWINISSKPVSQITLSDIALWAATFTNQPAN